MLHALADLLKLFPLGGRIQAPPLALMDRRLEAFGEAIVDKTYYLKENSVSYCLCTEITSFICVSFTSINHLFQRRVGLLTNPSDAVGAEVSA